MPHTGIERRSIHFRTAFRGRMDGLISAFSRGSLHEEIRVVIAHCLHGFSLCLYLWAYVCACVCAVDACECNGLIKPPNRSLFYISRVFNSASQIACVRVCMHIHTHARTNGWRSNVCVLRTSLARTHHHYGRKKEEA